MADNEKPNIDVSDEELDRMLRDDRHSAVIEKLDAIATRPHPSPPAFPNIPDHGEALAECIEGVKNVAREIRGLKFPEAPDMDKRFDELNANVVKLIEAVESRQMPIRFDIERSKLQLIESIVPIYK